MKQYFGEKGKGEERMSKEMFLKYQEMEDRKKLEMRGEIEEEEEAKKQRINRGWEMKEGVETDVCLFTLCLIPKHSQFQDLTLHLRPPT